MSTWSNRFFWRNQNEKIHVKWQFYVIVWRSGSELELVIRLNYQDTFSTL